MEEGRGNRRPDPNREGNSSKASRQRHTHSGGEREESLETGEGEGEGEGGNPMMFGNACLEMSLKVKIFLTRSLPLSHEMGTEGCEAPVHCLHYILHCSCPHSGVRSSVSIITQGKIGVFPRSEILSSIRA